ncbi:MAG: hypothetical protein DRJ65_11660, partial [Acidobacteria bacterium]
MVPDPPGWMFTPYNQTVKFKRIVLVAAAVSLALMVTVTVILHLSSVQSGVAQRVTAAIEAKTCLSVEFRSFGYRLWPATVKARGIVVLDPSGRILTIEAVDASWAWSELIGRTPRLRRLAIVGLDVDAFELPIPCSADGDLDPATDPWSAVAIDELTMSRTGVFGESSDLAFAWTGLEAQATLVDQHLDLRMTAKSLHLDREERTLFVGPLELQVEGSPETIELKTLKVTGGPLEFEGIGSAGGNGRAATAHVSATVDLGEILEWWDPSTAALVDPEGRLETTGDVSWDADAGLQANVQLSGQPISLAGYTLSRLEAAYRDGRLTAEAGDSSWGLINVDLGPDQKLEVKAQLNNADLTHALRRAAIELPPEIPEHVGLSGDLKIRMTLPPQIDRIKGSAKLEARWNGGNALFKGSADNGIVIDRAEVDVFGARAAVSGTVGFDGNIELAGAITVSEPGNTIAQLSTLLPGIESPAVGGGPLNATVHLSGTLGTPRGNAEIHWDTPEIEGNRLVAAHARVQGTIDDVNWAATLEAEGAQLDAEGTASMQSATVAGDWRLQAPDLGALQRNSTMPDDPEIAGSISGSGTLRIDSGSWGATAQIDAQNISAGLVTIPHLMLEARANPDCASIDSLALDIMGGHLEASGRLCPAGLDGEILATLQWSDLDPSQAFDTIPDQVQGLISGRLNLTGPLSDPTGSGLVSWHGTHDDLLLESAFLQAHLEHGVVEVSSDSLDSASGPLSLRATLPLGDVPRPEGLWVSAPSGPWQLSLEGRGLALAPLLAVLKRPDLKPTGTSDLDLRISWPPDQGGLPQGHLELGNFKVTVAGRTIAANHPIRVALDRRGIVVADIDIEDELSRLVAGGSYNLMTSEIDFSINGSLDPALASLLPVPVTIRGPLSIDGRVHGPADAWTGHLNLNHEGGTIEMRDPPLEITDAKIEAQWQDGILE